jgi:hypothetical protein
MKNAIPAIMACLLGVITGVFGGRILRPAKPVAGEAITSPNISHAPYQTQRVIADQDAAHTLGQLTRQLAQTQGDSVLGAQLEKIPSTELREWILSDWPDTGNVAVDAQTRSFLHQQIAIELFRRHGIEALHWADALEKSRRDDVMRSMVTEAARSDPAMAKPWVDQVMKDYGRFANYQMAALEGARSRSAEDLAKVQELYENMGWSGPMGGAPYAEDFDFRKFITLSAGKGFIGPEVTAWAARDAESAAAEIISQSKQSEKSARYTGALFEGVAAVQGDVSAARWIVGKLDEFPDEVRDQAVKSLRGNSMLSKSQVKAILDELPSPNDRMLYAAEVISPFGDSSSSLAALNAFDTVESQTALLLEMAPRYRYVISRKAHGSADALKFFESTMDKLNLPESARQQVMASLAEAPDHH